MAGLREYLLTRATPGEWTVEADAATDLNDEELALEVVREKIFRSFYQGTCRRCYGCGLHAILLQPTQGAIPCVAQRYRMRWTCCRSP